MTFLQYLEKMIKYMVSKLTLRTVSHCECCFYGFIQLKIGTAYLARTAQAQALARRTLVAKDLVWIWYLSESTFVFYHTVPVTIET